jgi:nucleoside-diphosphate-sugar epimerase
MPKVLVTGATGLVGSHTAARFRERGWEVRALVRPSSGTAFLESLHAELVRGDVTDVAGLSGTADGCHAVVHCAAHLGTPAPWSHFNAVNVQGTLNVVAESLRAGVQRFVHISTVAVYGHPTLHPSLPISETAPIDTPVGETDYYERSKRLAEMEVRRIPPETLAWCILRPDMVMGERDRILTPRVVRAARRGPPLVPSAGMNDLPVVYAGSVALAAWLAATKDAAVGRIYNVTDDGPMTLRAMLEMASDGLAEGLFALLPGERRLLVNQRNVWFVSRSDPFDGTAIAQELDWRPEISTREGWQRSVRWLDGREGNVVAAARPKGEE